MVTIFYLFRQKDKNKKTNKQKKTSGFLLFYTDSSNGNRAEYPFVLEKVAQGNAQLKAQGPWQSNPQGIQSQAGVRFTTQPVDVTRRFREPALKILSSLGKRGRTLGTIAQSFSLPYVSLSDSIRSNKTVLIDGG